MPSDTPQLRTEAAAKAFAVIAELAWYEDEDYGITRRALGEMTDNQIARLNALFQDAREALSRLHENSNPS